MMKQIGEVYATYKIPPHLQEHMLRVAAVANLICDQVKGDKGAVNTHQVVSVCLLHDMGNIIKFKLTYFPDLIPPDQIPYWQSVKDEYIQKYGPNEHDATYAICEELGLSTLRPFLERVGFSNTCVAAGCDSFEQKICTYADMRIGPRGVLSIDERTRDGQARFKDRGGKDEKSFFDARVACLQDLEKQICSRTDISPEAITSEAIEPYIQKLKTFNLYE